MRSINRENVIEEVQYINKILRGKKKGFKRISEEDYNLSDSKIISILNDLGYIKYKNQFVEQDMEQVSKRRKGQDVGHTVVQTLESSKSQDNKVIVVQGDGNVIQGQNKLNLLELMDNHNILMEMIEIYKKTKVVHGCGIVVQLPSEDDKLYKTSIRINKVVYEEFKKFCEDHREFSQKELISMALVEYMERYKKK